MRKHTLPSIFLVLFFTLFCIVSVRAAENASLPKPSGLNVAYTCGTTTATFRWTAPAGTAPNKYLLRIDNTSNPWANCGSSTTDTCTDVTATSYTRNVQVGQTYSWWVHSFFSPNHSTAVGSSFTASACPTATPTPAACQESGSCSYRPSRVWSRRGTTYYYDTRTCDKNPVTLSQLTTWCNSFPTEAPTPTITPTLAPTATPTPTLAPTATPTPVPPQNLALNKTIPVHGGDMFTIWNGQNNSSTTTQWQKMVDGSMTTGWYVNTNGAGNVTRGVVDLGNLYLISSFRYQVDWDTRAEYGTKAKIRVRVSTDNQNWTLIEEKEVSRGEVINIAAPAGTVGRYADITWTDSIGAGWNGWGYIREFMVFGPGTTPTPTPVIPLACPTRPQGDANCDGKIDMADFTIWKNEFNAANPDKNADFNRNSKIDLDDFEIWRVYFKNPPTPTPTKVPTVAPTPTTAASPSATLAPTATPVPTIVTQAAPTKILWSSYRAGAGSKLYTMNIDGTGVVAVPMGNLTNASDVKYSPDGTKIVFVSNTASDANSSEIYIMNANGTGLTRLTNNSVANSYPSLSPDNTKIVYTQHVNGYAKVFVMNVDGTGAAQVPTQYANNLHIRPSFVSNGTKIMYLSSPPSSSCSGSTCTYPPGSSAGGLFVMNLDGSSQTVQNWSASDFSVSPDGTKVVYLDGMKIMMRNIDGSGLVTVLDNVTIKSSPSLSPNNGVVVFTGTVPGNNAIPFEIQKINVNGTGLTRLTTDNTEDGWPQAR